MSLIQRPIASVSKGRRGTVILSFKDESKELNGEYRMRGGVCWPLNAMGRYIGYAVVVGEMLRDDKVVVRVVFEEREFSRVETFHDEDSSPALVYPGLAMWINQVWADYYCDRFFYCQDDYTHMRWVRKVRGSIVSGRTPRWSHVEITDGDSARDIITEHIEEERIWWTSGGTLEKAWDQYQVLAGGSQMVPAIHALTAALTGLDLYRWRAPVDEDEDIIIVGAHYDN